MHSWLLGLVASKLVVTHLLLSINRLLELLLLVKRLSILVYRLSKLVISCKVRRLVLVLITPEGREILLLVVLELLILIVVELRHLVFEVFVKSQEVLLGLLLIILSNTPTYPYRNF